MFFERPEVWWHLQDTWVAFHELSTERQIGMGMGPIPASKIRKHARDEFDLVDESAERFFSIIRQMDDEYLTTANSSKTPGQDARGPTNEVSGNDPDGIKQMFKAREARQKNGGGNPKVKTL